MFVCSLQVFNSARFGCLSALPCFHRCCGQPQPLSHAFQIYMSCHARYTLAKDNENRKVLRVVCRWDLSPTLAKELLDDLQEALGWLEVSSHQEVANCSAPLCKIPMAVQDTALPVHAECLRASAGEFGKLM